MSRQASTKRRDRTKLPGGMDPIGRRDLLAAAPFLAMLPQLLAAGAAEAAPDPAMTIVVPPKDIVFKATHADAPPQSTEGAPLFSQSSKPGIYLNLTKWYPGYMSAPHWYEYDRLCVVLSGTWWVASGNDFDPEATVPAGPGTFIRRVARTPHYDGVKANGTEPAVIAICGVGPITLHPVDPSKPEVRKV